MADETVWLSLNQIATLFERDKSVISKHLKNIFEEGEIARESVVARNATTAADGKTYQVEYFLKLGDHELLTHAGKISAEQAKEKAETEYATYRRLIDQQPSEVDSHLADALQKLERLDKKQNP